MQIVNVISVLTQHATKRWETRAAPVDCLCIHHSATSASITLEEIARYHVLEKGLPSIQYHYIIDADGVVYQTQPDEAFVWHGQDWNSGLGVCLLGDFSAAHPTPEQIAAARWLLAEKRREYGALRLVGHGEAPGAATECPGRTWGEWRAEIEGVTVAQVYPHINDVMNGQLEWLIAKGARGIKIIIKGQLDWLRKLREALPGIEIIGRWHWSNEEQARLLALPAAIAVNEMATRVCNDPCFALCDWIEGLNEIGGYPYRPNAGHEQIVRLMAIERGFSARVRVKGKRYLGGGWSTGNPDMQWLADPEYIALVTEYYDGANLHEYYAPLMQSPGYAGNVFRHHAWAARFPTLPLFITECGCDSLAPNPHLTPTHQGYRKLVGDPRQAASDLRWYLAGCAPTVRAISPYCCGVSDEQWRSFDWWNWGANELAALMAECAKEQPPPAPAVTGPTTEQIRNAAWQAIGVALNPTAAFQAYARARGLGAPLAGEFDLGGVRIQPYMGAVVCATIGAWDKTTHIAW